ncbi:methyltransferase domain-containing protein [Pigmentiphaga sp. YJ18]|uniref:methyltransferase domain-containing protein n=1 Tax=Pigmentiphaga sp. YJ18 TaxID=3134907 RepID=UPI0031145EE3
MAHLQQQQFCLSVKEKFPAFFSNRLVLDIGALDINGNNRFLFDDCLYLGLDVAEGRNVDLICAGHELLMPDATFDVIISTECFEHDQFYQKTLRNIYRMLKPGGLFLFSCATTGRPEHGTRRTNPHDAPLIQDKGGWADYYKNLEESDIREVFEVEADFSRFEFSIGHDTKDLYFYGIKTGEFDARANYSFSDASGERSRLVTTLRAEAEQGRQWKTELEQARVALLSTQQRLEQVVGRVNELERSTSWKVTRPLRMAGDALRAARTNPSVMRSAGLARVVVARPQLILKFLQYVRQHGVRQALQRVKQTAVATGITGVPAPLRLKEDGRCVILTTRHCSYVAGLIKMALQKVGFQAEIITERPKDGYEDLLHFVICPQMFPRLPARYVAFQMEQSVSSRWFTPEYFEMLKNAAAVFDYSRANLAFLESKGMSYRQVYYLPIGFDATLPLLPETEEEYDVLFYGDVNNIRRREYIEEISQHFRVKVVHGLFGADLYAEMAKAKLVVNIHYYEGALLETTRIYECLSLNKLVVSEASADMDEHRYLESIVDFVPVGDRAAMVERIRHWIHNDAARAVRIEDNRQKLLEPSLSFDYYFFRFLLAHDAIDFETFYALAGAGFKIDAEMVCLGLPESVQRRAGFEKDNTYGIQYFPGLRNTTGWVGCGLSYKFLFRKAAEQGLEQITICEDDVEFRSGWEASYQSAKRYLNGQRDWHIFSGLIAHLNSKASVRAVVDFEGQNYIHLDKMVSTVFNVYSNRVFDRLIAWDEGLRDPESNTYDRYMERMTDLQVVTTLPFIVGHKEEENSTLWGFNNVVYRDLILASQNLLADKVAVFKGQEPE